MSSRWLPLWVLAVALVASSTEGQGAYRLVVRSPAVAAVPGCGVGAHYAWVDVVVVASTTSRVPTGTRLALRVMNCTPVEAGCYAFQVDDLEVRRIAGGDLRVPLGLTGRHDVDWSPVPCP